MPGCPNSLEVDQSLFRQINVLLKDFTVNQFDKKKKFLAVNFSFFHVIFPQND